MPCIDCGGPVARPNRTLRCQPCHIGQRGADGKFAHRETPVCRGCNAEISGQGRTGLCRSCSSKVTAPGRMVSRRQTLKRPTAEAIAAGAREDREPDDDWQDDLQIASCQLLARILATNGWHRDAILRSRAQ